MPPTDVKGPKRKVKRVAAPRDAIFATPKPKKPVGPPAPKKKAVRTSAGPAGFTGPPVSKRVVRQRLAEQYTHRGPVKTAPEFVRAATPTPAVGPKRPGRLYARIKTQGPLGNTGHLLRDVKTGYYVTPTKGTPGYQASGVDKAIKSVATPVLKDYRDLTIGLAPAAVHLAGTALHDPGEAGKQLLEPYKQFVKDPIKSLKEHPLGTPALILGPLRGGSRLVGAGGRRGAFGAPGRRASSTTRAPATMPGTHLVHPREYDPGIVEKHIQVGLENRKARKVRRMNAKADRLDAQGQKAEARAVRHEAALKSPTRMTPEQAKRRAHEMESQQEEIRRQHATQADIETHGALRGRPRKVRRMVAQDLRSAAKQTRDPAEAKALRARAKAAKSEGPLPKQATPAIGLVSQNIVRPTVDDLKAYHAELAHQHEHGDLTPSQRLQNEHLREQITGAVDTGADMSRVQDAAAAYERAVSTRTAKLVKYKALEPETVAKRVELPYAVRHMDARRGRPDVSGEKAQAAKDLAAAYRSRTSAEVSHAKLQQELGVAKGRAQVLSRNVGGRKAEVTATREARRLERRMLKRNLEGAPHLDALEAQIVKLPLHDPRRLDLAGELALEKASLMESRQAAGRVGPRLTEDELALADAHQAYQRTLRSIQGLRGREGSAEGAQLHGDLLRERLTHLEGEASRLREHRDQLAKFVENFGGVRMSGGGMGVAQAHNALRASEVAVREARKAAKATEERVRVVRQNRPGKQFVTPERQPLSTEAIQETRQATGLPKPAYVSHAPNLTRPGSFYRHASKPVTTETRHFTGESVRKGTFDVSEEALHANVRKLQTIIDVRDGHRDFTEQAALRKPNDQIVQGRTHAEVQRQIDHLTKDSEGHVLPGHVSDWQIVNLEALRANRGQLQQLVDEVNHLDEVGAGGKGHPLTQALEAALEGKGTEGPFAAIPKVMADEQLAFLRTMGGSKSAAWNVALSVWRKTKLAFSPLWGFGNLAEATFRDLISGVTPLDWVRARKTFAQLAVDDPEAAGRMLAQMGHGGHYGFTERSQRFARAEEFTQERYGKTVREVAKLAGTAARTPVVNWVPKFYSAWTKHVFAEMARVEHQFRLGLAGRKIRAKLTEQGLNTVGRISQQAVEQAAKDLRNTPEQVQLARYVRRKYGQYEAFSPGQKRVIAQYTPFLAWTRNAVLFLLDVLPRDNPMLLALMADLQQSQDKWLGKEGLLPGRMNSLPAYMLGGARTSKGGIVRLGKYTPLGLAADPLESIGGVLMPMTREFQMAAYGLDPFGKPLKVSREQAIAEAAFGLFLPPIASSFVKGGSTVPLGQRLLRQVDPFYVTPPERVRLAQVSEGIDRIDTAKSKLFRGKLGAKASQSPEFKRLDLQERALKAERSGLFVKSGVSSGPVEELGAQIAQLQVRVDRMPQREKVDEFGFETKQVRALHDKINTLSKQRDRLLGKKPTRKVKRRPLTPAERQDKRIQTQLGRLKDPAGAAQERLNRQLERLKVATGG